MRGSSVQDLSFGFLEPPPLGRESNYTTVLSHPFALQVVKVTLCAFDMEPFPSLRAARATQASPRLCISYKGKALTSKKVPPALLRRWPCCGSRNQTHQVSRLRPRSPGCAPGLPAGTDAAGPSCVQPGRRRTLLPRPQERFRLESRPLKSGWQASPQATAGPREGLRILKWLKRSEKGET